MSSLEQILQDVGNSVKSAFSRPLTYSLLLALPIIGCGKSEPGKGTSFAVTSNAFPKEVLELALQKVRLNDPLYGYAPLVAESWQQQVPAGITVRNFAGGDFASAIGQMAGNASIIDLSDFLSANEYITETSWRGLYAFESKAGQLLRNKEILRGPPSKWYVPLGQRKLKAIEKVEHFDRKQLVLPTMMGPFDREMYTFVIKYGIESFIPDVPTPEKQYVGRASVSKNITTEAWECASGPAFGDYSSQLNDLGAAELLPFINASTERAKRKAEEEWLKAESKKREELQKRQADFRTSPLIFSLNENRAEFELRCDGGKPPLSCSLHLNGMPADNLLRRYTSHKKIRLLEAEEVLPLYNVNAGVDGEISDYAKGEKAFCKISMNHDWPLAFPPEIMAPIRARLAILDSSSPGKNAGLERIIELGNRLIAEKHGVREGQDWWGNKEIAGFYQWIELDGKPLISKTIQNGKWKVRFDYRDGWSGLRESGECVVELTQSGNTISGTFAEPERESGAPTGKTFAGRIQGSIKGSYIEFTKKYDVGRDIVRYEGMLNKNNVAQGAWKKGMFQDNWSMELVAPADASLEGRNIRPIATGSKPGEFVHGKLVKKTLDEILAARSEAEATHTHPGVDIVAPKGTQIYPLADGTIVDLITNDKDNDWKFLGYMAVIKHDDKLSNNDTYSIYLHMNESPSAKKGQKVLGGATLLGKIGATGAATGPHAHIEVRHFISRYMPDDGWNKPLNIYGKGDQTRTKRFHDYWEDPLAAFPERFGQPRNNQLEKQAIIDAYRRATDDVFIKQQKYRDGVAIYLQILKQLEVPAVAQQFSDWEIKDIRMISYYNIARYWSKTEKNVQETINWLTEPLKNGLLKEAC